MKSGEDFPLGEVTPGGQPLSRLRTAGGSVAVKPAFLKPDPQPVRVPVSAEEEKEESDRCDTQYPFPVVLLLLVSCIADSAFAASSVAVTVNRVRPGKGLVRIALVNKVQFHKRRKLKKPLQRGVVKPTDDSIQYRFKDVAPGEYAIQVLQDFDEDGNMTNNWLGLPKEPWGMSNNPPIGFGGPKWERAKFTVTDSSEVVKINLDLR